DAPRFEIHRGRRSEIEADDELRRGLARPFGVRVLGLQVLNDCQDLQKSIEWILSVLLTSNALSVVAEVEALLVKGCRGSISSGMGSGERIKRRLATWADVARSDRLHFRQRALARTAVFPDVRCKSLAPACAAAIAELVFEAHEPPRQPGGVLTRKRSEAPAKGADDCCHA